MKETRAAIDPDASLVIRQVYQLNPNSSTAIYDRPYIELYNRGDEPMSLGGLSIQMANGVGGETGWALALYKVVLSAVTVPPGASYLVYGQAPATLQGSPVTGDQFEPGLPAALLPSYTVALVRGTQVLTCSNVPTPCTETLAKVIDALSWGTEGGLEGAPLSTLRGDHSYERKLNGDQDTNVNTADFFANPNPVPRGMGSFVPPPDTNANAPIPVGNEATLAEDTWDFLYTGTNPIQVGVQASEIDDARVGLVTGSVTDRSGLPLTGVKVSVVGEVEYGHTFTRAGGRFDLAVNGGTYYTLRFEKSDYLPVDRLVSVDWHGTGGVSEVVMTQLDPNGVSVAFGPQSPSRTVQGSEESDANGARRGVLVVPGQVSAQMKLPNGTWQNITQGTVRITEYTVGPKGPAAMPAPLPPNTAYTYAMELSVDQAIDAGAEEVKFTGGTLAYYVDNFLSFNVGEPVPTGYYDPRKRAWVPSASGRVVKILSKNLNTVQLDLGNGVQATPQELALAGVTAPELAELYARYPSGKTLWRVPITHFSSWDCNWPFGPPSCEGGGTICAGSTGQVEAQPKPKCGGGETGGTVAPGSILHCEAQALGESVPVAGTPFSLNYLSSRVPGFSGDREIPLTLTGPEELHSKLKRVDVRVFVAGRTYRQSYPRQKNLKGVVRWDGLDGFGRPVYGSANALVEITSVYGGEYQGSSGRFNTPPSTGVPIYGDRARTEISYPRTFTVTLPARPPLETWLQGGWSLSEHHFYDSNAGEVYLGNGGRFKAATLGQVELVAGNGTMTYTAENTSALDGGIEELDNIAVAPNGDIYEALASERVVRKISRASGLVTTVAGTRNVYQCAGGIGDGEPATEAVLYSPEDVAVGPDGSLYIATAAAHRVRRVSPDGTIDTLAGSSPCPANSHNPVGGFGGDGEPANQALLNRPWRLAAAPDGAVYIWDSGNKRIRRVDSSGVIETVAGNGATGMPASFPINALSTSLPTVNDISVGPDGTLYIAALYKIMSLSADGLLRAVSGTYSTSSVFNEGVLMAAEPVNNPVSISVGREGTVYYTDWLDGRHYIRAIAPNRYVNSISWGENGTEDGALALGDGPVMGGASLAVMPDGSVLLGERDDGEGPPFPKHIYAIRTGVGRSCPDGTLVPAPDGSEAYCFENTGRHLRTLDVLTGATRYAFGYAAERLATITDESSKVTEVLRTGNQIAITGPHLQRTTIDLDSNGNATKIADDEAFTKLEPQANGLLNALEDRLHKRHEFIFDGVGRLTHDRDPELFTQRLTRATLTNGYRVTRWTPLQRATQHEVTEDTSKATLWTVKMPELTVQSTKVKRDGSSEITSPDGTVVKSYFGLEPLFGTPRLTRQTTTLPAGGTRTITRDWSTVPQILDDPFGADSQTTTTGINGNSWTTAYTKDTRTFVTTSPRGRKLTTVLDSLGRASSTQIGGMEKMEYFYDEYGRLEAVEQGGRTVVHEFEPSGVGRGYRAQTSVLTDTNPQEIWDVTNFTRDVMGRPTSESTPTLTTSFNWDAAGHLVRVTMPDQEIHEQGLWPRQLLANYTPPAAGMPYFATSYTYDADRALDVETRPHDTSAAGVPIDRNYDSAGRLNAINFSDGYVGLFYYPPTATGTGAPGSLQTLIGPYGVNLGFEYNGFLPTRTTWTGTVAGWTGQIVGSVSRQHNAEFRPSSETVFGATFSGVVSSSTAHFAYDEDGLLTCASLTSPCSSATTKLTLLRNCAPESTCTSSENGLVKSITLGNITEELTYNAYGELSRQVARFGSNPPFLDITYDVVVGNANSRPRDALGRIERKIENIAGVTRTYDYFYNANKQLAEVKRDNSVYEHFEYDDNGNRMVDSPTPIGAQAVTSATYDDQDRLLAYGTTMNFTYSASGALKTRTAKTTTSQYTYDPLGNLLKVASGTTTVEYAVDGFGRRVWRRKGANVKRWLYGEGFSPVAELDSTGKVVAQFVYGSRKNVPDFVIRPKVGGADVYRVISDHLGSPRYVMNVVTGELAYRATYTAFGRPLDVTGADWFPFGFAGGIYDWDTTLVRFGARDYDPSRGRWVSKDPLRFAGGQANLYVYVGNDPVNLTDPSGLVLPGVIAAGALIGGATSFVGSVIVQASMGGWDCIKWEDAFIAGGVGAIQGALAPFGGIAAAAAVGAVAGGVQYGITEAVHDRELQGDRLWAAVLLGGLSGAGGKFVQVGFGKQPMRFKEGGVLGNMPQDIVHHLNGTGIAAATSLRSVSVSSITGTTSNLPGAD